MKHEVSSHTHTHTHTHTQTHTHTHCRQSHMWFPTCIKYPKFYFVTKLYIFRASTVHIIRSYQLYTWQLECFMQVTWPLPRRARLEPDSPRQLPRVQLITPDDGHSRCPKHVEFRYKIKFWILDASCWLFIRRLSRCTVT
jgi:hypothetical protein